MQIIRYKTEPELNIPESTEPQLQPSSITPRAITPMDEPTDLNSIPSSPGEN